MSNGRDCVLLGDIGGTNARFALMNGREIGAIDHLKVVDFAGVTDAIATFLQRRAPRCKLDTAVLGVAGLVENNCCTITNSRWVVDGAKLKQAFGLGAVELLNDFEAAAWSLPELHPQDLYPLGEQRSIAGAPMLALGAGTGFGAACLFFSDGRPFVAATEAGHATLPATSDREAEVIAHLRRRFGHVSVERVLSGRGLENLYQALACIDGVTAPARDAAAITRAALEGNCDICQATLDMFCSFLGAVAGDLTLTFAARGGVYIAGGIVPRFADRLSRSCFRKQFESKGRFVSYLRDIPTRVVVGPDEGLIGLKAYFQHKIAGSQGRP